jgi:hypothetical protein
VLATKGLSGLHYRPAQGALALRITVYTDIDQARAAAERLAEERR